MSSRIYEMKPGEKIPEKRYVDVPENDIYRKHNIVDGEAYIGVYDIFEQRLSKLIHDFEQEHGLEVVASLQHSYYANVHDQKIVLRCKELVPEGSYVLMKETVRE